MNYTRIYSDVQGETRFEDVTVSLTDHGVVGFLSGGYEVVELQFTENKKDYNWDFHPAPARQFIVLLDGEIEVETSLAGVRRFKGGDILLVEDVPGKGHCTGNIKHQIRRSLFIKLNPYHE
jgi:hypothetical protein